MRILTAALSALLLVACADAQTTTSAASASVIAPDSAHALQTFTSDANGFDTHSFWLDTGREVVVFDAQFTEAYANQVIGDIRAKTASPIRWVVVTHPNPDKFNGAIAFQKIGAKVIASEATAGAIPGVHAYKKGYFVNVAHAFTDATYPAEAKIDVTFRGDYELPLEGTTKVRLHELKHAGVSSTQTVAFVPQLDALVVGDLVHHDAHAWLEGGIVDGKPAPDLGSWALALDELRAYGHATVYGGRGEPAKLDEAVSDEKAYLARMDAIVTKYVAEHAASNDEAKAIRALAVAAFPDDALPYLIDYGVYGLVGAKRAAMGRR
jgi:glyoxylase-like metal-dependent hydrolase (beta-lactamase superfamily II)